MIMRIRKKIIFNTMKMKTQIQKTIHIMIIQMNPMTVNMLRNIVEICLKTMRGKKKIMNTLVNNFIKI